MKMDKRGNINNLRVPTSEQAREYGRKGGLASAESHAKKKRLREALEVLLDMQDEDAMAGINQTNALAIALAMVGKAKKGDVQAAVYVRDTSGEKPVDENELNIKSIPESVVKWI